MKDLFKMKVLGPERIGGRASKITPLKIYVAPKSDTGWVAVSRKWIHDKGIDPALGFTILYDDEDNSFYIWFEPSPDVKKYKFGSNKRGGKAYVLAYAGKAVVALSKEFGRGTIYLGVDHFSNEDYKHVYRLRKASPMDQMTSI